MDDMLDAQTDDEVESDKDDQGERILYPKSVMNKAHQNGHHAMVLASTDYDNESKRLAEDPHLILTTLDESLKDLLEQVEAMEDSLAKAVDAGNLTKAKAADLTKEKLEALIPEGTKDKVAETFHVYKSLMMKCGKKGLVAQIERAAAKGFLPLFERDAIWPTSPARSCM